MDKFPTFYICIIFQFPLYNIDKILTKWVSLVKYTLCQIALKGGLKHDGESQIFANADRLILIISFAIFSEVPFLVVTT